MSDGIRLTHVGLCVRDTHLATEFYCAALGFTEVGRMQFNDAATAQLLDVPGLVLDLVYLQRDGFRLELLGYEQPGTIGEPGPRAMNRLGFTHLSFRVDDVDGVADAIVAHGGRAFPERTVAFDGGNRGVMAADLDGNLLELIERTSRQGD
ncbi:VOC family protein [Mycolicibacterium sp. 120270]|uniref:VOC family protein n=1 Tax=Mycolicibacterium sp. 120270 TaxID=3090600 RepID=UPI00299D6B18|nr:VOC family protein [Mycolicibacterium sp. 120270]MDX1882233.1 VOC family protein [Mycolicibacterium sp. 120270]